MMRGWDTALDAQVDLLASFTAREGREYLRGFIQHLGRAGVIDSRTGLEAISENGNLDLAERLVNVCCNELRICEPFYVSDELTQLIDFAAEKFRPEPLLPTDLTVPAGFAYFDAPLYIIDRRGMRMPFRALQWFHGRQTEHAGDAWVVIALYHHRNDPDPDQAPGVKSMRELKVAGSDLAMEYATVLRFGQDSTAYREDQSLSDMFAHIKVFFRLCQQTIAVPTPERVSRPVWKRAARWKPVKEVVVFRLRRAKSPTYEGPEREVHWSHRWFVSGHWRNQWYPSEKTHRQIWIAPFIKGPDNKPIVYKRRAFELVR